MPDARQQAIENAAREALAHGGPAAYTDPSRFLEAMTTAQELGATHQDIADEMHHQRNA